jgi:plastocyanin
MRCINGKQIIHYFNKKEVLMSIKAIIGALLILILIAGCGGGGDQQTERRQPAATATVDPATAGAIQTTVTFEGSAPTPTRINMAADRTCQDLHTEPVYTQDVVVNEDGTLRNVFVYVKEGLEGYSFPVSEESVVLDQNGCWYAPRVFGLMVGQTLIIRNSDPTLHNVHAVARANREFNIGQPVKGMESTRTFNQVEVMLPFKCDVHPWMNAYAGILSHPYFGVTQENGKVNIGDLPPGEYVIAAWHEKYGEQTQHITVGERETKELSFTFTAEPVS